ncbi:unnamed protein product, partial [Prorocentrum cordatum]
ETLSRLPAAVIVDAKGLYDKHQTTVYNFWGKEKRTDAEATTLKEGTTALANSLTKGHEPGQLRMHYRSSHRWKLVYDAKYQSARKRKECYARRVQMHREGYSQPHQEQLST